MCSDTLGCGVPCFELGSLIDFGRWLTAVAGNKRSRTYTSVQLNTAKFVENKKNNYKKG